MDIFSLFKKWYNKFKSNPPKIKTRFSGILTPTVYIDTHTSETSIFTKYKAISILDAASFYAPYIPLQVGSAVETKKLYEGTMQGWHTFLIDTTLSIFNSESHIQPDEIITWCYENMGKRHKGIYIEGLQLWLGNFGKWRQDYTTSGIRIWVKDPNLITLFKLRWG